MSALTVWLGIEERLRTIDGVQAIMLGEPTAIHDAPAIIAVYADLNRSLQNSPPASNLTATTHGFVLRLAIKWQDNPQAEMQLITLADAIPDAIGADPHLGGRLTKGLAKVTDGLVGFVDYAQERFRIIDYTCSVLEKA